MTQLTESFLNESGDFALPMESIHQFLNLQEEVVRAQLDKINSLRAFNAEGERIYTTDSKWQRLKDKILATLKEFHKTHALVPGMDMEELRGKLPYTLSAKIFRAVVDALISDKTIAKEENLLRTAEHRVQLGGQEKSLMDGIKKILGEQPMSPPDLKEIEKQLGVNRNKLTEVIRLLERDRSVIRVATDLYYLSSTVDQVRAVLKKFLSEKGEITAAIISRPHRFQPQVHDSPFGIFRPRGPHHQNRRCSAPQIFSCRREITRTIHGARPRSEHRSEWAQERRASRTSTGLGYSLAFSML